MRESSDQKNFEYGYFSRSETAFHCFKLKLTRSHNDVETETITDVEIDIYLGMRTHVFRNLSNF